MLNFVQRVLVGKANGAVSTVSVSGTTQSGTLQIAGSQPVLAGISLGDLYLVDENNVLLDAGTAGAAQKARVIRGTGNGKVTTGHLMTKPTPSTRYTFEAYSAPVAQVSTFTNLLALLQPNTQYQLQVVIQQDLPLIANRQSRITVSLFTGATVSTADIDRLVVNFNKQRDVSSVIVASRSANNLVLTGKSIPTAGIADYEFVRFDTNFLTLTSGATGATLSPQIATQADITVAAAGGRGVAIQVRQLERVALGNSGFTYARDQWYRGSFPFGAVDGVTYAIYNVQQNISGEGMLQDTKTYPVSTLIAINNNSAQQTGAGSFGAILDAFMAPVVAE